MGAPRGNFNGGDILAFLKEFLGKLTGKEILALAAIVSITLLGIMLVIYPSDLKIFGYILFLVAALGGFVWRDYRKDLSVDS